MIWARFKTEKQLRSCGAYQDDFRDWCIDDEDTLWVDERHVGQVIDIMDKEYGCGLKRKARKVHWAVEEFLTVKTHPELYL